jgi:hypothetical protein
MRTQFVLAGTKYPIPSERTEIMNRDNRVLSRKNARELTVEETGKVHGALRTGAACTFFNGKLDGPILDC